MKLLAHTALSAPLALTLALAIPSLALSHAFPTHSEPRVGWTIANSPPKVTTWFDGELEPAFSTIAVYNSAKQQDDKTNSHINSNDATVLHVDRPNLWPVSCRVPSHAVP